MIGLAASALVSALTPAFTPSRSSRVAPSPFLGEDENAARRGRTVKDGVIVEEDEQDERIASMGEALDNKQKVD